MAPPFRYFLMLSCVFHAALIAATGFTFGSPLPIPRPALAIWGSLPSLHVASAPGRPSGSRFLPSGPKETAARVRIPPRPARLSEKPAAGPLPAKERRLPASPEAPAVFERRNESVVMIHPLLPYQLQMYFKDRRSVHLELEFKIMAGGKKSWIVIRRKVSSGNLDADLLCSRYLGHYLFIQQARFAPNVWHPVRVDLSE